MKILAGRAKDLDDVHAMLKARQHALDFDLVYDTLSMLEQALDQSQSDLTPAFTRALERAGLQHDR